MGTENMTLGPGTLYIENPETGEKQEISPVIGGEVQPSLYMGEVPEECSMKLAKGLEDKEITINIESPWSALFSRKMSRKRFVKLLMAHNLDRNTANAVAEYCRYMKINYAVFAFAIDPLHK